tara:strand:- start:110 stop:262 length:153 start_codon:yes stop_codon:yes gene_type:complete
VPEGLNPNVNPGEPKELLQSSKFVESLSSQEAGALGCVNDRYVEAKPYEV